MPGLDALADAELDADNDLGYLLGLAAEADANDAFESDEARARWAVAQFCQETDYVPDCRDYDATETVSPGDQERLPDAVAFQGGDE